ncbi:substrate-binding domain-containing protein [Fluviibacterium sp. DFM31]|uniref:Substrate-binding domain-containing protein n=1 Tax=Meridianimarinicoccus marinus TaxID=3231483 RepID=A0ABV3L4E4_9RHOB
MMRRILLGAAATLALTAGGAVAQDKDKTLCWISHGGPADPVWTYFLQGAEDWPDATGYSVSTSFHSGDVPSHQEAMRAALAAGADGICSTSPDPGSMVDVAAEARAEGIPAVNFNTSDDAPDCNAYVGGDLKAFGRIWAQYLVDNGHVKEGDFVWIPVEVPGASYGVEEEKGIAEVFEPMNITWEVTDATRDQAEVIQRMTDYVIVNGDKISAMIGLGDKVTGSVARG